MRRTSANWWMGIVLILGAVGSFGGFVWKVFQADSFWLMGLLLLSTALTGILGAICLTNGIRNPLKAIPYLYLPFQRILTYEPSLVLRLLVVGAALLLFLVPLVAPWFYSVTGEIGLARSARWVGFCGAIVIFCMSTVYYAWALLSFRIYLKSSADLRHGFRNIFLDETFEGGSSTAIRRALGKVTRGLYSAFVDQSLSEEHGQETLLVVALHYADFDRNQLVARHVYSENVHVAKLIQPAVNSGGLSLPLLHIDASKRAVPGSMAAWVFLNKAEIHRHLKPTATAPRAYVYSSEFAASVGVDWANDLEGVLSDELAQLFTPLEYIATPVILTDPDARSTHVCAGVLSAFASREAFFNEFHLRLLLDGARYVQAICRRHFKGLDKDALASAFDAASQALQEGKLRPDMDLVSDLHTVGSLATEFGDTRTVSTEHEIRHPDSNKRTGYHFSTTCFRGGDRIDPRVLLTKAHEAGVLRHFEYRLIVRHLERALLLDRVDYVVVPISVPSLLAGDLPDLLGQCSYVLEIRERNTAIVLQVPASGLRTSEVESVARRMRECARHRVRLSIGMDEPSSVVAVRRLLELEHKLVSLVTLPILDEYKEFAEELMDDGYDVVAGRVERLVELQRSPWQSVTGVFGVAFSHSDHSQA